MSFAEHGRRLVPIATAFLALHAAAACPRTQVAAPFVRRPDPPRVDVSPITAEELAKAQKACVHSAQGPFDPVPLGSPLSKEAALRLDNRGEPYPQDLADAGYEGTVHLMLGVGADGRLACIALVRGCHPDFDNAALRHLRHAIWSPGEDAQGPVDSLKEYRYRFELVE